MPSGAEGAAISSPDFIRNPQALTGSATVSTMTNAQSSKPAPASKAGARKPGVLRSTFLKIKVSGGKTLTYIFRPPRRLSALLKALLGTLIATVSHYGAAQTLSANALPTGGAVGAGAGTITTTGSAMKVTQATQDMVVNWNTFNIGTNASVQFAQPNSSAIALNRVVTTDPSLIYGSLTANGKVFLVNPNGVLFGQNARVDVGGMVTSTLNISDADFLAGRGTGQYKFSGGGNGSVVNLGTINAADGGYIAMLAPQVRNEGVITARLGSVVLAGGNKMTLDTSGDGLIKVAVDEGAVGALASNKGLVKADGGLVYMGAKGAGDLAATVVNNEGVIEARGLVARDGKIMLVAEGGSANVGGTINASAGDATANGGEVRALAMDGTTDFNGRIEAKGGSQAGNGGFVEVSGSLVKLDGTVNTLAPHGKGGTFLLDPIDIEINTVSTQGGFTLVTPGSIETALGTNGSVVVDATVAGTAAQGGDIQINSSINSASTGSLTLTAADQITSGFGTTVSLSSGTLNLNAGLGGISTIGALNVGTLNTNSVGSQVFVGTVTAPNMGLTTTGSGSVINMSTYQGGSLSATTNNGAASITASAGSIQANSLAIGTGAGTLTSNAAAVTLGTVTAGSLNVTAATTINGITGANSVATPTANLIAGTGIGNTQAVNLSGTTALSVQSTNGNVALNNNSTGAVTATSLQTGAGDVLYAQTGGGSLSVTSGLSTNGNVTLSNAGAMTVGTVSAAAANKNVTLTTTAGGDLTVGAVTAGGNAGVTAAGAIKDDGNGGTTITANTVSLTAATGIGATGTMQTNSTGAITFANSGSGAVQITDSSSTSTFAGTNNGAAISLTDTSSAGFRSGASGISSGNGDITIKADKMAITQTVNAGTGKVTLRTNTGGTAVDVGSAVDTTAGTLELSATEIGQVTAAKLAIGDSAAGALNVTQNLSSPAATLHLISGATVATTGGSKITATNLAVEAGTGINLASAAPNTVTSVAASTTTGDVFFNNSTDLTIGNAVDGVSGIATGSGSVVLEAAGNIGQSAAISANSLSARSTAGATGVSLTNSSNAIGTVAATAAVGGVSIVNAADLTVGAVAANNTVIFGQTGITAANNQAVDVSVTGAGKTLTVSNAVTTTGTGAVTLAADDMAVNAAVSTGTGTATLRQYNNGRAIGLGTGTGNLRLDAAEVANVSTGGTLAIGDTNSGTVTVGAAITSTASSLNITSGSDVAFAQDAATGLTVGGTVNVAANSGAITGQATTATDIQAGTVILSAKNGIGSADAIETKASNLNFSNSTANAVKVTNTNAGGVTVSGSNSASSGVNITETAGLMTVGSVNGLDRVTAGGGALNLTGVGVTVGGTGVGITGGSGASITVDGTSAAVTVNSSISGTSGTGAAAITLRGTGVNNASTVISGADGATGGSITIDAKTGSFTNTGSVTADSNSANTIAVTAEDAALTGTISAGAGKATFTTTNNATAITLGGGGAGLGLSSAEFNTITATGGVTIGTSSHTGTITLDNNLSVDPAKVPTLNITNGGQIDSGNAAYTVSQTGAGVSLNLDATGGIGATNPIGVNVTNLSAINRTSGNLRLAPVGSVTLGGGGNVIDQQALNGSLTINAGGNIVLAGDVKINGNGAITLNANGTITRTGGQLITGAAYDGLTGSVVLGDLNTTTGIGASGAAVQTKTSALTATSTNGELRVDNSGSLTIAGATSSTGGNLSVTSTGNLNVNAATSATGGDLSLSTNGGTMFVTAGVTQNTAGKGLALTAFHVDNQSTISGTTGGVSITANSLGGGGIFTNEIAGSVASGTGAISIVADDVVLKAGSTVGTAATAGTVSITTSTAGTNIDLGGAGGSTLGLTDTELLTVKSTGGVTIGSTGHTGQIVQSANMALSTLGNNLTLANSGDIALSTFNLDVGANNLAMTANGTGAAGGAISGSGVLTAAGGSFTAGAGINLSGNNVVNTVSLTNSKTGGATNNVNYVSSNAAGVTVSGSTNNTGAHTFTVQEKDATVGLTVGGGNINTAAGNGVVTLKTDKIAVTGTINSGTANTYLLPNTNGTAVSVGGASTFDLQQGELTNITAGTIVVGEDATPTVTGGAVTFGAAAVDIGARNLTLSGTSITGGANTLTTTGNVTLKASTGSVQGGAAATDIAANTLTVNAAAGIGDTTQLKTQVSTLSFTNATSGNVNVSDAKVSGVTVSGSNAGAGSITVAETAGAMTVGSSGVSAGTGSVSLSGKDGMALNGNVTTTSNSITLNADSDNNGTGTLTVAAGKQAKTTTSGAVNVTAADLTLTGNVSSAGAASVTVSNGGTLGLGTATGQMTVDNNELANISAAGGTTFTTTGAAGDMTATGVTTTATANLGTVTLTGGHDITFGTGTDAFTGALAATAANNAVINGTLTTGSSKNLTITATAGNIQFASGASVSAGDTTPGGTASLTMNSAGAMSGAGSLTLKAQNSYTLSNNLTTNGATVIDTDQDGDGFGSYSDGGKTLNTTGNTLALTAADLTLTGATNVGTSTATITASHNNSIGLGATAGTMTISGSELQTITAGTLNVNSSHDGAAIVVDGITATNSGGVDTVVLTAAGGGNPAIRFDTGASTFKALTAQADAGVYVTTNVTTNTGALTLDGNYNTAPQFFDDVQFAAGVVADAKTVLTLGNASHGGIVRGLGALTLNAGDGVNLNISGTAAGTLTVNADTNNNGVGALTVAPSTTLSTTGGNNMLITAADLDLQGALNSSGTLQVTTSNNGKLGLGAGSGADQMVVSAAELGRITATSGTTFTANNTITVNAVTAGADANLGGLTLDNTGAAADINFSTGASSFQGSVTAKAGQTLSVSADQSFTGTGQALALQAKGDILTTAKLQSTTNAVGMTLTSDSDSNSAGRVSVGGNMTSLGGAITLTGGTGFGFGTAATGAGVGVDNSTIDAGGGSIVMNGKGDTGGAGGSGVSISASTVKTNGAGTITVSGVGGVGGDTNVGVGVETSTLQTANGAITVNGTGGSGGTPLNHIGVSFQNFGAGAAVAQATGTGTVTITGTGGPGAGSSGVRFIGTGSGVSTNSGTISVTGTGGAGADGVAIGVPGFNGASIASSSGAVLISGTGAGGGSGISSVGSSVGNATASGDILFRSLGATGSQLDLTVQTSGNVTVNAVGGGNINQNGGSIKAAALRVINDTTDTTASLNQSGNDVATLAVNLAGANSLLAFRDATGFAVGAATTFDGTASTTTNGITIGTSTANNTATLIAGGAVTQSQGIAAGGLELLGTGSYALTGNSNTVSKLAGSISSGTGGIAYKNTAALDINTVGATATLATQGGTIAVTTSAGDLTVTNPVNATASGDVVLTSAAKILGSGLVTGNNVTLDSDTGVGVNAGTRFNTAAVTLAARTRTSGDVFVSQTGDATLANITAATTVANGAAAGGTYDLTSSGNITVGTGGVNTAGTGDTLLTTTGAKNIVINANVGNATATKTTTLTSSGNITGTGGTVTGDNVVLSSATGIGTGTSGRVNTSANTLAASATTAGSNVFVSEANAVTLATIGAVVNGAATTGTYDVTAAGTITVGTGGVNTANAGDTKLTTTSGGNIDIGANDVGNAAAGKNTILTSAGNIVGTTGTVFGDNVALGSVTGVGTSAAARLKTSAATLAAAATQANAGVFVSEANGVALDTNNGVANGTNAGTYDVTAAGTLDVKGAVNTGTGAVNLTSSTANISESAGTVTGGTLTTSSQTGTVLGGANAVTGINATNVVNGAITLNNTAALDIKGISQTGGGTTTITNTGSVTTSGGITTDGNVNITANGASDDITISSGITYNSATTAGAVSLVAKRDVNVLTNPIQSIGGRALGVTLNADSDATNGGAATVTGNILTTGGDVVIGGGATPATVAAKGRAGNANGVTVNATIDAGAGKITINGAGEDAAGGSKFGVELQASSALSTTSGNITVTGQGGNGAGSASNVGVVVRKTVSAVDGNIVITGTRGDGATNNESVFIGGAGSAVQTTGAGNVTVTGNAGGTVTGDGNVGVRILGATVAAAGTGNVNVTGTGGAGVNFNHGVIIQNAGVVSGAGGTVTVTGTGGAATGADNQGVRLDTATGAISATGGSIVVTGTGGGTGGSGGDAGVYLTGANITATNAATITVTGTGASPATSNQAGVRIGSTSGVTSVNGDISITGTAGGSANGAANSFGVHLVSAGVVSATGTGNVSLIGTGASNQASSGVNIQLGGGTNVVSSNTGTVLLNSKSGTGMLLDNVNVTSNNRVTLNAQGANSVVQENGNSMVGTPDLLLLSDAASTFSLASTTNDVTGKLAADLASVSTMSYRDANGFDVGTVGATNGIKVGATGTAGNNVTLNAGGAVTQSQAVIADGLELLGSGSYTLTDPTTANSIAKLAGNTTNSVKYYQAAGFAIDTVNTAGLTSTNIVSLSSGGAVTQTQKVAASGLELLGAGSYALTLTTNDVTTLAGSTTGAVSYTDANGFTVGTVNTAGLTTNNAAINLNTTAANSLLTVTNNVASGGGAITYTTDNITLTGTTNSGSGLVTIKPTAAAQAIAIGTGATDAAGTLAIDNNELTTIVSTGGLTIGSGSQAGTITVVGNGSTTGVTGGTVLLQGGSANINVNATLSTPASDAAATTATGNIVFGAAGQVDATGASKNVTLTASGGSIDGDAASFTNVKGNLLTMTATKGIGSANAIETTVTKVVATNGAAATAGDIKVLESDGLDIGAVSNTFSGGAIDIQTTNGSITTSGAIAATGAGTVTMVAGGAGNSITTSTAITSGSGAVSLSAQNGISLNAGSGVTTTGTYGANADSEANGTGTYAQAAGVAVASGAATITAADVDLQGTIAAGAANVNFVTSTPGATIGIGDTGRNFNLSDAELDNVATTGVVNIGTTATNTGGVWIGTNENLTQAAKHFNVATTGSVTVGGAFTTTGNLTITSLNKIQDTTDISAGAGFNSDHVLTGGNVTLTATNGIGTSHAGTYNPIAVQATSGSAGLTATNGAGGTGTGDVALVQPTSDLTIKGTGSVVSGAVITNTATDGAIDVATLAGTITIDGTVSTAGNGAIYVNAGGAGKNLVMNNGSVAQSGATGTGTGLIDLTADTDIQLAQAKNNAATGVVNLTATNGTILDNNGTTNNVTSNTLNATAKTRIGDVNTADVTKSVLVGPADALETSINVLNATLTAAGDIAVDNTNGGTLTVNGVTLGVNTGNDVWIRNDNNLVATNMGATVADVLRSGNGATTTNNVGLVAAAGTLTLPNTAINVGTGSLNFQGGVDVASLGTTAANRITANDLLLKSGSSETVVTDVRNVDVAITGAANAFTITQDAGAAAAKNAKDLTFKDLDADGFSGRTASGSLSVTQMHSNANVTFQDKVYLATAGAGANFTTKVAQTGAASGTNPGGGYADSVQASDDNSGGNVISASGNVTLGSSAINDGTLNVQGRFTNNGALNVSTGTTAIFSAPSADIVFTGNSSAAGNVTLTPGNANDVIFQPGSTLNVVSSSTGTGSLLITGADQVVWKAAAGPLAAAKVNVDGAMTIQNVYSVQMEAGTQVNVGLNRLVSGSDSFDASTNVGTITMAPTASIVAPGSVILRSDPAVVRTVGATDLPGTPGTLGNTVVGNVTVDSNGDGFATVLNGGVVKTNLVNARLAIEGTGVDLNGTLTSGNANSSLVPYIGATTGGIHANTDAAGAAAITNFQGAVLVSTTGDIGGTGGTGTASGTPISLSIGKVAAETTGGNIIVRESGSATGLSIDTLSTFDVNGNAVAKAGAKVLGGAGKVITITAGSPLVVNAAVSNASGGDITLAAEGTTTADKLTVNAPVTASGGNGNINLYGGGDVLMNAASNVSAAGTGAIDVRAGYNYANGTPVDGVAGSNITMAGTAVIGSAAGNVSLRTRGNIAVATVTADSDSAGAIGNVTVDATTNGISTGFTGGAITDALGAETPNIVGTIVTLNAGSGVGTSDNINVTAGNATVPGTIAGNNTTSGGFNVALTGNTTVGAISAAGQTVTIAAGGSLIGGAGSSITGNSLVISGNNTVGTAVAPVNTTVSNLTLTTKDTFLSNTGPLTLMTSTVSGDLGIQNASGGITNADNQNIQVTGNANFSAAGNIDLGTKSANDIANFGSLTLITTGGGNATVVEDSATVMKNASSVSGNLSLTALGSITDSANAATVTVGGTTRLDANITGVAQDITLANAANDFGGNVTIVKGNNVSLKDVNGLTLDGAVTGNLTTVVGTTTTFGTTTVGGNLSQTGAGLVSQGTGTTLSVTGTSNFTNGAGNDITLANTGNDFVGNVTVTSGNNVSLKDANALTVGGTVTGNLTTVAGTTTTYNTTTVGGNLSQTGAGLVSQGTGTTLGVTGTSTFTNGAGNDIVLTNAGNDFVGAVSVVSGNNVSVTDTNALVLGTSTISGNAVEVANGAITQTGPLTVAGTTSLTAGAANNITLTDANNDFVGAVSVVSGKDVSITDKNALLLGTSTISGNAVVVANGPITQTGTGVTIASTTSLTAGAGNNIALTIAANDFGGAVTIVSGNNVGLKDANSLTVQGTVSGDLDTTAVTTTTYGTTTVAGNLLQTGGGLVSQTGPVTVAGTSTFANGTSDITLTNGGNDFVGAVTSTGGNISLVDGAGGLVLANTTATGNLSADATGGALTNTATAAIGATGNATLKGATVTIGTGGTDTFNAGTLTFASPGAVSINEDSATTLAGTSTAASLVLGSTGAIDNAAGASTTVTGNANLAGTAITLGKAAGDTFNAGSLTFNSAGAVDIAEDSATSVTGTNTASALTLASTGALTDTAGSSTTVTGNANLSGASITFGKAAGDTFNAGSLTFNSAGAVDVAEDSATSLTGTSTASALTLASTGAVTNTAAASVTVTGNANVSGTSITLGKSAGDTFNAGSLTFNSAGAVDVAEDSATSVTGTNTASALTLASTGAIDNTAAASITVTGATALSGTSVTLGKAAGDTFNTGTLNFNSAGAVDIAEDSATSVTGANTASALTLASAGALTNTAGAALAVTGNANLSGTSISIGKAAGDTFNAGSLTFNSAGAVDITEDSATSVAGTNTASALTLASAGALDNAAGASTTVTGNSNVSGTSINLGNAAGDTFNTGTLTFNSAGAVAITENSSTMVTGASTSANLVLASTGDLLSDNAGGATMTVSGTIVSLLAGGTIGGLPVPAGQPTTVRGGVSYNTFGTLTAPNALVTVSAGGVDSNSVSVDVVGSALGNVLVLVPPAIPVGAVLFNGQSQDVGPFVKAMSPANNAIQNAQDTENNAMGNGLGVNSSLMDLLSREAFPSESVRVQMSQGNSAVSMLQPLVRIEGLVLNVNPDLAAALQRQLEAERRQQNLDDEERRRRNPR